MGVKTRSRKGKLVNQKAESPDRKAKEFHAKKGTSSVASHMLSAGGVAQTVIDKAIKGSKLVGAGGEVEDKDVDFRKVSGGVADTSTFSQGADVNDLAQVGLDAYLHSLDELSFDDVEKESRGDKKAWTSHKRARPSNEAVLSTGVKKPRVAVNNNASKSMVRDGEDDRVNADTLRGQENSTETDLFGKPGVAKDVIDGVESSNGGNSRRDSFDDASRDVLSPILPSSPRREPATPLKDSFDPTPDSKPPPPRPNKGSDGVNEEKGEGVDLDGTREKSGKRLVFPDKLDSTFDSFGYRKNRGGGNDPGGGGGNDPGGDPARGPGGPRGPGGSGGPGGIPPPDGEKPFSFTQGYMDENRVPGMAQSRDVNLGFDEKMDRLKRAQASGAQTEGSVMTPQLRDLSTRTKFPFRIIHHAAVEKFLLTVDFPSFMKFVRDHHPDLIRTAAALDIPATELIQNSKSLLVFWGDKIGIKKLKYSSNSKLKDISDEYQEILMCVMGLVISAAVTPMLSNRGQTHIANTTREVDQVAQANANVGSNSTLVNATMQNVGPTGSWEQDMRSLSKMFPTGKNQQTLLFS